MLTSTIAILFATGVLGQIVPGPCLSNEKQCGGPGLCIPLTYSCCSGGGGCPPTERCVPNGCCPIGRECGGNGGIDVNYRTDTIFSDTTSTSYFSSATTSTSKSTSTSATTDTFVFSSATTSAATVATTGTTSPAGNSTIPAGTAGPAGETPISFTGDAARNGDSTKKQALLGLGLAALFML